MAKKVIRMTEGDFYNMVSESVQQILKENMSQNGPHLEDVINGLYENGSTKVDVNADKTDVAVLEIEGISGTYYDVQLTLEYHFDRMETSYNEEGYDNSSAEIVDVSITYYDDYNEMHSVDYVKDEEFENTLMEYVEVDFMDYDETSHYGYPY
ncbi:MAG: hypothetical protein IKT40_08975 [Bacilli bacterium]|nr:hypothetical protein [Bacilli bacterium]